MNRSLKTAVTILLIFAARGAAQTEQTVAKTDWLSSAVTDIGHLPKDILQDSNDTFLRKDNLMALMLAGGASIAMHNTSADDHLAGFAERHRAFNSFWDEGFDILGSPATHFAATGLWYALSVENQDSFNKDRAWTMIRALSTTGLVTVSLKAIRNNDCPNGKPWAWPSGHTSSSFTVASVLDEFYGHEIGIPAYALASLVAYRMVDAEDHWGSDIVFGATLGWVVGHTVAGKHKQLELAGFQVSPYADGGAMGINMIKTF